MLKETKNKYLSREVLEVKRVSLNSKKVYSKKSAKAIVEETRRAE